MPRERIRYAPILLLCASCAPAVYSFHATPKRVCPGESVKLEWQASKPGTISAQPAQASPGQVPATGTASVVPTSSVRYHLEVSNFWGTAARDDEVELLAARSLAIGNSVADPSASCEGSTLSVTAVAPANAWSAQAVVGGITTLTEDKHRYHVEHAGVKLDLTPGEVSQALAGKPVAGAWLLSLTLLDAEKCGTPTVPRNLGLQLVAACSTGAP
jgi:hypothetical protein